MDKLHFGCGKEILDGYDNFDKKDFDFNEFPYPIKDNTYDYVFSKCVFEHLGDLNRVLEELVRICKNNAEILIIVPYYNSFGAFNDLGHTHWFNDDAWMNIKIKGIKVSKVKCISSEIGFLIPFRRFFSRYLNGLIKQIHITLIIEK